MGKLKQSMKFSAKKVSCSERNEKRKKNCAFDKISDLDNVKNKNYFQNLNNNEVAFLSCQISHYSGKFNISCGTAGGGGGGGGG